MRKQIDWVGTWFELLAKRGFQTDVILASGEPGSDQMTDFKRYSHARFDGVGVILEHLRSLGLKPPVPTLSEKFFGTWFNKMTGLIANLRFVPVFGAHWKKMTSLPSSGEGTYVYRILSKDQTSEILNASKASGASVNSQLLWSLDQVLRAEWIDESGPFYWMVPVNMRGAAKKANDTSNHASWVWVDTFKTKTPIEIQNQIHERFKESFHWGAWFGLNIGKWIGLRGMNFLLKQAENIQEHWVGTFSNVGAWKVNSDPIAIIVPTAPSTPLSAGCITVNDRLALSLHVDP